MEPEMIQDHSKDVFTIPNMLSAARIAMIPAFMFAYLSIEQPVIASLIVCLSAATDIVDGIIARKFNMISDFGKALDPIADKLTQLALMLCILKSFPHMIFLIVMIVVKEFITGVLGLITLKKTGIVKGAVWHGKLTTVLLFIVMLMHILWENIDRTLSDISIAMCFCMMALSFVLYSIRYIRTIKENVTGNGK